MVDLHQMKQFIAVADEGSFHRAAEKLFMTQPPLSMAIRKLEEEIGCRLLVRKHRGLSLTVAGDFFLKEVKHLVGNVENVLRQVRQIADGQAGCLRISFVGSALYGKLPETIRKFRKKYGTVKLELRMATSWEQYEMLTKNETDLAVLNEAWPHSGQFEARTFDQDKFCLALPAGHKLAVPTTTLADLKGEPFIIWPRAQGRGFYDKAIELCGRAGFSPNIVQEAHQMQAILSLVAVEAGLAIVPLSMSGFRPEEIVYVPISDEEAVFFRSILFRKDSDHAALRRFIDMVMDKPFDKEEE